MATFQERFNTLFDESSKSQKEFGEQFGASGVHDRPKTHGSNRFWWPLIIELS